ncbi:MAG: hypothetical protein VKJ46_08035 [Leptolyngbyaceae bacterium]|nr:hypothetical protein [Leptolyngbyaceae bacterium]
MATKIPLFQFSFLLILLSGLGSCSDRATSQFLSTLPNSQPRVEITQIRDFKPQPDPTPVYLEGVVGKQVPFLAMRVYELQDATGKIWVLTKENPPRMGAKVLIKGTVKHHDITLGGKTTTEVYVEQQELLTKTEDAPSKPLGS